LCCRITPLRLTLPPYSKPYYSIKADTIPLSHHTANHITPLRLTLPLSHHTANHITPLRLTLPLSHHTANHITPLRLTLSLYHTIQQTALITPLIRLQILHFDQGCNFVYTILTQVFQAFGIHKSRTTLMVKHFIRTVCNYLELMLFLRVTGKPTYPRSYMLTGQHITCLLYSVQ